MSETFDPEQHDIAKFLPAVVGEDYELMKASIGSSLGLIDAIVIYQGKVLEGWTRLRICRELGIEPTFTEYMGDDPLGYVIAKNLRRRHLPAADRAYLALEVLPKFEAEVLRKESARKQGLLPRGSSPQGNAAAQAAKATGTSERSVYRAQTVRDQGTPNLNKAVHDKVMSLVRAEELAHEPPEVQDAEVAEARKAKAGKDKGKPKKEKPAKTRRGEKAKGLKLFGQLVRVMDWLDLLDQPMKLHLEHVVQALQAV